MNSTINIINLLLVTGTKLNILVSPALVLNKVNDIYIVYDLDQYNLIIKIILN